MKDISKHFHILVVPEHITDHTDQTLIQLLHTNSCMQVSTKLNHRVRSHVLQVERNQESYNLDRRAQNLHLINGSENKSYSISVRWKLPLLPGYHQKIEVKVPLGHQDCY